MHKVEDLYPPHLRGPLKFLPSPPKRFGIPFSVPFPSVYVRRSQVYFCSVGYCNTNNRIVESSAARFGRTGSSVAANLCSGIPVDVDMQGP